MAELGLPFQGKIWYYVEDSYGEGPSDNTALPISIKVLDARVGIGDKHKPLRGFDKPEADILLEQCNDFTFHIEYIPQVGDTFFEDAVKRQANCKLKSLAFVLETNSCTSESDDKTWYVMSGAKCKTNRLSGSHNTEYVFALDFSVKESEPSDVCDYDDDEPSELGGEICAFNIAGSISDGSNPLAYILDSIDLTIDNGIKDHWNHDSLDKQYAIEGELDITGSCDISLDEGGGVHFQEVIDQDAFTIEINLGDTGALQITLTGCQWKNSEPDVNSGGDIMKESAPFTATGFEIDTV
jgi:hypothetical protein